MILLPPCQGNSPPVLLGPGGCGFRQTLEFARLAITERRRALALVVRDRSLFIPPTHGQTHNNHLRAVAKDRASSRGGVARPPCARKAP